MNPRWILAAATAGGLLLVLFAFRAGGPGESTAASAAESRRAEGTVPAPPARATAKPTDTALEAPLAPAAASTALALPQILDAIQEASISYDAKELPKIQPHLIHPDPEVREAALNGVLVLGDAAGSPLLRQAAGTLKDPREAVKYLEAADYLELPSGSLLSGKRKAGSPAKDEAGKDGQPTGRLPRKRD